MGADGIEDVHGAGDGDVGVGVEAGDEVLALVVEVAGDVEAAVLSGGGGDEGVLVAVAVGLAGEALLEQRHGFVADHAEGAGEGEAAGGAVAGLVVAALPGGVEHDGLALEMVEAEAHGAERGDADGDGAGDAIGEEDGPLEHLHAADGGSDGELEALDAEVVDELDLRADDVADADEGEGGAVGLAGGGIDGAGAGGAVTGAEDVDADDAVAGEIEQAEVAGEEELRPPGADLGGAGEGVTDEDGVVARGVELTVDGVVEGGVDEDFAAFEGEDFVEDEVSLEGRAGIGIRDETSSSTAPCAGRQDSHWFAASSWSQGALVLWPLAAAMAWSRSARMSRMSSVPTERRTSSGVTPVAACSATVSCAWVVEAGWMTSDLESPRLARWEKSLTESMSFLPAS